MTFDVKQFMGTNFKIRTEAVKITEEALARFCDSDDPIWVIKGLNAEELSKVRLAVEQNKNVAELVGKLVSGDPKEKIDAMLESLGISKDKLPDDLIKRIAALKYGTVEPRFSDQEKETNHAFFVKVADVAPTTFYDLTNKIFELTGEGKLGELKGSGKKKKSKKS